jgi:phosphoglycerate kinase
MTVTNTIFDLKILPGTKVILRLDLNVPTDNTGNITNTFRIDEAIPTILALQKIGAKIVILAHKEDGSLLQISNYLQNRLQSFHFHPETTPDKSILTQIFEIRDIVLLENVRNDKREKSKDQSERDALGQIFSSYGDVYVNEAFSASHRDHASITSIAKFFPTDQKTLGPKFLEEIEKLGLALNPVHPMFLLVGGAKFDTKLPMLEKFLTIADKIFVGGALAHSFWKSKNYELGKSLIDAEVVLSEKVLSADKIILPTDVQIESKEVKQPKELSSEEKIVDFGPKTLENILQIANNANTIVWNGPVDFYEGGFDWGTKMLIEEFSKMTDKTIILGGGDTVTEIDRVRIEKRKVDPTFDFHFTHVSTGGGAMIDFLSNGTLPGIEAIKS